MRQWFIAVMVVIGIAEPASAQEVTITQQGNALSVTPGSKAKAGGTLDLTCDGLDCTKLKVSLGTTQIATASAPSATSASYPIPPSAAAGDQIEIKNLDGLTVRLEIEPLAGGGAVESARTTISLADLLRRVCGSPPAAAAYDRKNNIAQLVVSPLGNVLDRPAESIDEDDQVRVIVWGDPDLLPQLRVRRTSPFRDPGGIRIVGGEGDAGQLRRLSSREAPCETLLVELGDFEPGKGVVEIAVVGAAEEQKIGSFEIGIAPLYTGAFSFGAVWTKLANPTFGLVFNGTDSIITETDDAGPFRIKYAIFYTPFLSGARDIRKPGININPTIGIVLNDVSNNVLVGASIDVLSSAYLTAGVHAGRVRRIDEESQLEIGDPFDGNSTQIPVQRRWRTQFFLGTSIDIRAAIQLFRVVLGAPGS